MVYTAPATLVRAQQLEAWGYYGSYGMTSPSPLPNQGQPSNAVGEVRYVVGWASDQMSRMQWDVLVDGSADWELELADGTAIRSSIGEGENAHSHASTKVLKSIGWTNRAVRLVTTNLYVAGELFYVFVDGCWRVISVAHPDQKRLLDSAEHVVRGLWPSPVDPSQPDAPLFGVLSILQDMDWLSRMSRAQSANRAGMRGILGSADGLNFAEGGDFWVEWDRALRKKMNDPTDVGPVHLRGAKELVEPAVGGRGMAGLSWVIPDFPYDARIESRMEAMIQRLAYGLPVPPEILLGLSAQSRATAFQIEENSYRAHIEPPAQIVAQVATDVLSTLFPDNVIEVKPDPVLLLAKRSTVQDTKDAFDRGVVSEAYLREVLGIPDRAAPSEEELARREVIGLDQAQQGGGHSPTTETPRQRAARADREDQSGAPADQKSLTLATWRGKIEIALFRALDRVGAKVRTHKSSRATLPTELSNADLPGHLGLVAIESMGIDVAGILSESLACLAPATTAGDNLVDALTEYALENLFDSATALEIEDERLTEILQGVATLSE